MIGIFSEIGIEIVDHRQEELNLIFCFEFDFTLPSISELFPYT